MPDVLANAVVSEPIDSLEEHPQNPREGDVGAIVTAVEENGYLVPVVAQVSTRRVIDGNHRLKAARALGMTEVPVVWVDVDDETALRHLLAANRTNDLARYDDQALVAILADLQQSTERGLAGTAFDGDFLDTLIADLTTDVPPRRDAVPPDERKAIQYDVSTIRQIILVLDPETFERVMLSLRELRERNPAWQTNTDAIVGLLDEAAAQAPGA